MLDTSLKTTKIDSLYIGKNEEEVVEEWKVPISTTARVCRNYIREIVDNLNLEPNPEKKVIALSIGDPTVYGNLAPSKEINDALTKAVIDGNAGYTDPRGRPEARQAIAKYLSHGGVTYTIDDIFMSNGCSSALDLCITVLADGSAGHNILMPRPGFPIYKTLAECIGVEVRQYNLVPDRNWEIDLEDLESKIDGRTAAIVVTNPSNPCSSVYSAKHLVRVLEVARRRRVPIIADEIYERLVFPGHRFVSMASLNSRVPMLICGGLAKRFLAPGWRTGWIAVHDPVNALDNVRRGLRKLAARILAPNSLVQAALPTILLDTPQTFHDDLINSLLETARYAYAAIKEIKGLEPYMPQGAMYMMVKLQDEYFPEFKNGLEFVRRLMQEESVFCLPGEAFFLAGYMRIIITIPVDLMEVACQRMADFCDRYYTPKANPLTER